MIFNAFMGYYEGFFFNFLIFMNYQFGELIAHQWPLKIEEGKPQKMNFAM